MKKAHPNDTTFFSSVSMLFMATTVICMYVIAALLLQPKGKLTCDSFGSYYDIPADWGITMPWLDGDKNGKPCQELYNKTVKK